MVMSVTVIGSHVNTRSTCHIKNNKYRFVESEEIESMREMNYEESRHVPINEEGKMREGKEGALW